MKKIKLSEEQEREMEINSQYNVPRTVERDIIKHFPNTTVKEADLLWKACVVKALAKFGDECISDNSCRGMSYANHLMMRELRELAFLKDSGKSEYGHKLLKESIDKFEESIRKDFNISCKNEDGSYRDIVDVLSDLGDKWNGGK